MGWDEVKNAFFTSYMYILFLRITPVVFFFSTCRYRKFEEHTSDILCGKLAACEEQQEAGTHSMVSHSPCKIVTT